VSQAEQIPHAKNSGKSYIMIAGPTASGKSQLALDLVEKIDGEIINADSMQLYADLSVLTARPTRADLDAAPHHLYGVLDAAHRASVAEWLRLAAEAMAPVIQRGKMPIIVGGTGMYLDAAVKGIAPIPDVPVPVHNTCSARFKEIGGASFRAELAAYDPVIAERLDDGDSQRLIRAMGVVLASGIPLSQWQAAPHHGALAGMPLKLAVLPPRDIIYHRIESRFDMMLKNGALDEVRALQLRNLDPSLPVMKALGVKPLADTLGGAMSLERAAYLTKRDSRHYAKRQMTWLRNNYNANYTLNEKLSESFYKKIFPFIR
jgi:tRNA dimethylallyltransferase